MCFPVPFSESPATRKHIWALHLRLAAPLDRLSACQISFAHCRFLKFCIPYIPISNLTLLVTRIWSSPDLLSTVTNFLLSRANMVTSNMLKTVLGTLSCHHCKTISGTIQYPTIQFRWSPAFLPAAHWTLWRGESSPILMLSLLSWFSKSITRKSGAKILQVHGSGDELVWFLWNILRIHKNSKYIMKDILFEYMKYIVYIDIDRFVHFTWKGTLGKTHLSTVDTLGLVILDRTSVEWNKSTFFNHGDGCPPCPWTIVVNKQSAGKIWFKKENGARLNKAKWCKMYCKM